MSRRAAAAVHALLAILVLACAGSQARAAGDEASLRRRVQRFYVLSYLERHGEMWEMFTRELQERMGGDKREYVSSARQAGFELYSSRIERVEMRGADAAVVDVALQVQMPGALDVTWRRHRMAWRWADDAWRYSGSLDVTHEDRDVAGQELLPTPNAEPAAGGSELLPPRTTLPPSARVTPPAPAAPPPAPALSSDDPLEGNRWDLVAIGPDGKPLPPPPAVPPSLEPAAPPPAEPASPAAAPAPPAPAVVARAEPASPRAAQWLPTERAASAVEPSAPQEPPQGKGSRTRDGRPAKSALPGGEEGSVDELVRRAATTSGVSRLRALEKLRHVADPRFPELATKALPEAPPGSQVVFLERLAVLGRAEHAAVVRRYVRSEIPDVREAALRALADLGSPADAPLVVEALRAEDATGPRTAALLSLGRLGGGGDAGAELVARAVGDAKLGDVERSAAADAAGLARIAAAEPALLRVIGQRRPFETFVSAVAAAGRLGSPACLRALEALVAEGGTAASLHEERPVRLLALRALSNADVPGAGMRLAREMLAIGTEVPASDVEIVAGTGDMPALAELLAHPSLAVRTRAADLLGRSVDDPAAAAAALPAIERAMAATSDARVLLSLRRAKERLVATAKR